MSAYLVGLSADAPCAETAPRIDPAGVHGALVICGGGDLTEAIQKRFVELAGGANARIIVIPTASESADAASVEALLKPWTSHQAADVSLLHVRTKEEADKAEVVEPLKRANGVWFGGGDQSRLATAYLGTAVERELHALLERGGVIGGTSAGAAILSRAMIAGGNPEPRLGTGFDFLPLAIIDQHFEQRRREPRLIRALEAHPACVGFGVDEATALVVRGRMLEVVGKGNVIVRLAGSAQRAPLRRVWKPGSIGDLVSLQRSALARAEMPFPPEQMPEPVVPKGALVIVGGGGMPADVTKKFIDLAGGPDSLIVVLPTANPPEPGGTPSGEGRFLERAGAKNVKVLPQRTVREVESPEFLDVLKEAKGIWFGGGRQWRFVDCYEQTAAIAAMHGVLERGGVIGGSSAGATIQGDYLCRGSPLGNLDIMAEGYERGFAFLPGTGIDQHFAQRKRFADMSRLVSVHPQLLGIGLDEATAIVVQGSRAEVFGKSQVHFYDRSKPLVAGEPDYVSLGAGKVYDLKIRKPAE